MRKVEEPGLSECVLRHPSFSFFALCVFLPPRPSQTGFYCGIGRQHIKVKGVYPQLAGNRIGQSGLANAPVPSAIAKPETIQRGDTRICRVRRPRGAN
jgi:hypothetical protein